MSSSRSPMSNRRRHVGNREEPTVSPCLGIFGLSLYTTERELEKEFSKFGPLEKVTVVLDGKVTSYSFLPCFVRGCVNFLSTSNLISPYYFGDSTIFDKGFFPQEKTQNYHLRYYKLGCPNNFTRRECLRWFIYCLPRLRLGRASMQALGRKRVLQTR